MSTRQWRIGWKPIDKASAEPKWLGKMPFDCFDDASRVAGELNKSDPLNHYCVDLIPEGTAKNGDAGEKPKGADHV